jgi:uncharacterized protein (DUF58 family)
MGISRFVLLLFLLLLNFLFIDFPGAKIAFYGVLAALFSNYLYKRLIAKNFQIRRDSETYKIFAGIREVNTLVVSNPTLFPVHALSVIDYTDLNISTEQSHPSLISVPSYGEKRFDYLINGRKRGKYKTGPSIVKFKDLMGLFSFEYEFDTIKEIIVYPDIIKTVNIPFKSMQPLGAIKNRVPIFEDPSIITGLREYQLGDEIKRINWKISAKYDKFLVNTYQPTISSGSLIFLNLLETDYDYKNKEYYIERGIETAASLVSQFFLLRQDIAFVSNCRIDNEDNVLSTPLGKGKEHFSDILTQMAIMEPARKMRVSEAIGIAELSIPWGVSIYVLTPRLSEADLFQLVTFQKSGHTIVIINIGPEIRRDLSLWNVGFLSYYAEIQNGFVSLMKI